MKHLLILLTVAISLSYTTKNTNKETADGYYYYAYASLDKDYKHVYITPVLFIPKSKCDMEDPRSEYGISNQFNDYIKAEYNGIIYKVEGKVYNSWTFSEADAVKSRRETMKLYKSNTKIDDFKYLCD
ncbi:hypothetical protein Q2T40_18370 [Winogradskyella maritima]|uniref:Uncharacterized protein n=1 Tax=Winogradskyella maritima TaxID=1517766 RepID=A0ABV8AHC5_9FLAO|nr:hypothetical protein [Winogradskyella maritima]